MVKPCETLAFDGETGETQFLVHPQIRWSIVTCPVLVDGDLEGQSPHHRMNPHLGIGHRPVLMDFKKKNLLKIISYGIIFDLPIVG